MKVFIGLAIITMAVTSCTFEDFTDEEITGNGILEKGNYTVDEFSEIEVNGQYNLILIQDTTWEVQVEAESNLFEFIDVYKQGNILFVETEDGFLFDLNEDIIVKVHHAGLSSVSHSDEGDIKGFNEKEQMHLFLSGTNNVDVELYCSELDLSVSGDSELKLQGRADDAHITISKTAYLFAENLLIKNCWNTISGTGTEYINVSDNLHATISGTGQIYYLGNPLVYKNITGTGSVSKKQ